jgi:EpsI family protein
MSALKNRYTIILTAVLLVQLAVMNLGARQEIVPEIAPLTLFPDRIGPWKIEQEFPIEKEILDVLKADDTLNRLYSKGPEIATLFVAFFKTQRTGQAPHSPKNCLPGSGWEPSSVGVQDIHFGGPVPPIRVNRYIVSRGSEKSLVLYWYQNRDRVVASEYHAKFWLVADSIRYRRSDTSLVRVVVRVANNDEAAAVKTGMDFVKTIYPALRTHLPT